VLRVSRSGYYGWLGRVIGPPVGRAAQDQELLAEIRAIHAEFGYYGAPRVRQELRARQHVAGRHRVARLMRLHGIRARRGKVKSKPRAAPPARRPEIIDLVKRDFTASAPGRLWFTDQTVIRTDEGFLHAVAVLDAFNREIIAYATDTYETPLTARRALRDAIASKRPTRGCVIHSDRGYQFTAHDWIRLARKHRLQVSIGERKSAFDNAAMESWFGSLKNEEFYPKGQPATKAEARTRLFQYVWTYNNRRLHSTLDYRTPIEYARINKRKLSAKAG
jgi:putative transposase